MKRVKYLDKEFELYIAAEKVQEAVKKVADDINKEFEGKEPAFIAVLNGSFMFASDLLKYIELPCTISFLKLSSYDGTSTTGSVKKLIGFKKEKEMEGRPVIILEDIVDTGITLENIVAQLNEHNPSELKVATCLYKPQAYQKQIPIDYVGLEIPNDFILGYGLDYNEYGRNLADIYKVVE